MSLKLPQLEDVRQAATVLDGTAHRTPLLTSRSLSQRSGNKLYFKSEHLQRSGAFKFRGAFHALSRIHVAGAASTVVTQSSGNHAQALSLAGQILGLQVHVVMPEEAPEVKRRATIDYDASIHPCLQNQEDRMRVLRQVQQDTRSHYVAPYDDPQVIAGQGTVALEMLQELPTLDALIIPVGGGGLLGGMAMTAKSMKPSIRVYGAEPVGADDAHRSLIAGKPLPMHHPQTIADGLLTSLGDWTWPLIESHVDDILTVSDSEITGAMTLLWSRMKQVVEPSGAVALAVALTEGFQSRHQSQRIGVVLSGGNVDLSFFHRHKQP